MYIIDRSSRSPNSIQNRKKSHVEVDCPRCQATITIVDQDEDVYCQECGATLALEIGGAGFAMVSAEKDEDSRQAAQDPNSEEEPSSLNDPVLADHSRWKTACTFIMLFGLTLLGCAAYSGVSEYFDKGVRAFTRGQEATLFWVIVGVSLFLMTGGGIVYGITHSETKRYLRTLEARAKQAGQ